MARDFTLSIDAGFIRHRKTRKLVRLLGGDERAPLYLIQFWTWAAEFTPDGELDHIDPPEIEDGAGWDGAPGALWAALKDAGWVDDSADGARIHGWMEPGRTGYALVQQEKARDRWRRAKGIPTCTDVSARNPRGTNAESAVTPAGVREDSAVLHGSRFTVHEEIGPSAPARDPSATGQGPALWPAVRWKDAYGRAWCERYKQLHYGMASDTKGIVALGTLLEQMPPSDRIRAQERAPRMFAEFLASTSPAEVKARHPFAFFVTAFGGLLVDATPQPAARGSPARGEPSTATREAAARVLERRGEMPR